MTGFTKARRTFLFCLGLAAILLLYLRLQNYTNASAFVGILKTPEPRHYRIQEMFQKASEEETPQEEEKLESTLISGTDHEFLKGLPPRTYPAGSKLAPEVERKNNTKYILMWVEAYGKKEYGFRHGQTRFLENNCKVKECFTTDNRQLLSSVDQFSAIMFHQRSTFKNDLPLVRSPNQRYVMWMMESASYPYGFHGDHYKNFYNETMTFRRNADFFHPYGHILSKKPHPTEERKLKEFIEQFGKNNRHLASGKTKKVAWFVSNCHSMSGREQYVKKLQQYIQVDIYGNCGPLKCSRRDEISCWKKVEAEYKFYLSFENSICQDYVTEKFFNAMNRTIIPVTLGGTNYTEIAPTHSHIAVIPDYLDPKSLAEYLHFLDDDDSKYAEYFWWKPYYSNVKKAYDRGQAWCDLCEMLHTTGLEQKSIANLHELWTTSAKCGNVMRMAQNKG